VKTIRSPTIDLDHCRDVNTHSIDIWAQNFLDTGRHSYSEVTPSGTGCRIWGVTDSSGVLHKKFSLMIDGKEVAVELFRRTNKALTITGYALDTIRELTNIDRVIRLGDRMGRTPQGGSCGRSGKGCWAHKRLQQQQFQIQH
jgi:hypothetical protein